MSAGADNAGMGGFAVKETRVEAHREAPLAADEALVRVHHPDGNVRLRGAGEWNKDQVTRLVDGAQVLRTKLTQTTEIKPVLHTPEGLKWARGKNFRLSPGQTLDIYPRFHGSNAGQVEKLDLGYRYNDETGAAQVRHVHVYLPPGYKENPHKFPLVIMQDGEAVFSSWRGKEAMDEVMSSGVKEAVVVGIEHTHAGRIHEYTPSKDAEMNKGGGAEAYLQFLNNTVLPDLRKRFRLSDQTYIGGSSLGGLVALHAGVTQPKTFTRVMALSPSIWWNDKEVLEKYKKLGAQRPDKIYIDSGDQNSPGSSSTSLDGRDNAIALAQVARDKGFHDEQNLEHVIGKGDWHFEPFWAKRLPHALKFTLSDHPNQMP